MSIYTSPEITYDGREDYTFNDVIIDSSIFFPRFDVYKIVNNEEQLFVWDALLYTPSENRLVVTIKSGKLSINDKFIVKFTER